MQYEDITLNDIRQMLKENEEDRVFGQNVTTQPDNPVFHPIKRGLTDQNVFQEMMIATALFKGGEMEGWGRGIPDIYELCKEAGMPEPEFDFVTNFVCLTIRFKQPITPHLTDHGELNGSLIGALNGVLNEALKGLGATVIATYEIIKGNPGIQRKDIIVLTKRGSSTIDRHLAVLIERKLIEHRDSKKTGGYYPL